MLSFKKAPETSSALSEFMRNGSAKEHKRVFKKVIKESIREQRKVIEQAELINAGGFISVNHPYRRWHFRLGSRR